AVLPQFQNQPLNSVSMIEIMIGTPLTGHTIHSSIPGDFYHFLKPHTTTKTNDSSVP
ncbi:hypothetical protein HAX54_052404, partial [Datura stramonium]|nr:hypothetical protein [Datura stramonium]